MTWQISILRDIYTTGSGSRMLSFIDSNKFFSLPLCHLSSFFVKAHFYVLPLTGVCISPSVYHFIPHVSFQAEMFWIYMKKKLYLLGLGTTEMLLSCTSWRHLSTTLPMSTTNFPYPIFYFIHSLFFSFLGNPSCRVYCTAR